MCLRNNSGGLYFVKPFLTMNLKDSTQFPFWNFTLTLLFILTLPYLLQDGMFTDGVLYTAVSKNLANGLGSLWFPHFSDTMFLPFFHQQPPLTFGIQALFFKLFGNSIYCERFYSFFTLFVSAFLIHRIWRKVYEEEKEVRQISWLPVLLWIIIPVCYWAYSNNVEENTMGIFTLFSTLCMYKGLLQKNANSFFYLAAGSLLALMASLCKGFPGLFPVIIPFLHWLVFRSLSLKRMILFSFVTITTLLLAYALLLSNTDARTSLSAYLSDRVINSIKNVSTEDDRFYLIKQLLAELLVPFIVVALLSFYLKIKSVHVKAKTDDINRMLFFLLIGLSASVPLIVTLEQRRFYLVTSLPFYAISFAILVAPALAHMINRLQTNTTGFRIFRNISIVVLLTGCCYSFSFTGKTSRNEDKLHDVYVIGKVIQPGKIIQVDPETWNDWGLHNYFIRHFNISLAKDNNTYGYLLVDKKLHKQPGPGYTNLHLATLRYELYKMKKTD